MRNKNKYLLVSGLSAVIFLIPSLSFSKTGSNPYPLTGLAMPSPERLAYINSQMVPIGEILPNALAKERAVKSSGAKPGLPSRVVNYQYLPKVGQQLLGDCSAWTTCYYYKTWQESKEHGWGRSDPAKNPERVFSPAFGYNLCWNDSGSYPPDILLAIRDHGCATYADMPYTGDASKYPTETQWRNAIPYRAESCSAMEVQSDTGFNNLKQLLANGEIASIGINVFNNFVDYPDGTSTSDEVITADNGGKIGGHGVTVIGYDDNKGGGAFLLVNSWANTKAGDGVSQWGVTVPEIGSEKGYFWMSYNYIRNNSWNSLPRQVYLMVDKIGYVPNIFARVGINHPVRNDIVLTFQGENDKDHPIWSFLCLNRLGGGMKVDQNVVLDLTNDSKVKYNPQKVLWLKVRDEGPASSKKSKGEPETGTITYAGVSVNGSADMVSKDAPIATVNDQDVYLMIMPPPSVNTVTPNVGCTSLNNPIMLGGAGFYGPKTSPDISSVKLDDAASTVLTNVSVSNDSALTAIVPAGVKIGTYNVLVTTSAGTNTTSGEKYESVVARIPRVIKYMYMPAGNTSVPVSVDSTIEIFFSCPLDKSTLEKSFQLTVSGISKPGTCAYSTDNKYTHTVIFTPSLKFKTSTNYQMTILKELKSIDNVEMGYDYSWRFITEAVAYTQGDGGIRLDKNVLNPDKGEKVTIGCKISQPGDIKISVYNIMGIVVKKLFFSASYQTSMSVKWDGTNDNGDKVGSGIYLIHIESGSLNQTKKVVILR